MADEADIASESIDLQLARALANVDPVPTGPGSTECDDCGEEMLPFRTRHGYRVCVECQTIRERRG